MKNRYEVRGEITAIFLNRKDGGVVETLIATSDLGRAQEFPNTWCAVWFPDTQSFYCDGMLYHTGTKNTHVRLHRWLTQCPAGLVVDHINNDTLDNRRDNLRIVTYAENPQNRSGANRNSQSGTRGVYWDAERGVWRAMIRTNGKRLHLGRFTNLQEAETVVKVALAKYMPFSKEAEEMKA